MKRESIKRRWGGELPCHVTRAGDDLIVVDESTAGQVAGVSGQLPAHSNVALARLETINGAYVVEATAGDKAARRRVCTCHDPTGAQRNGVYLVGGVRVPDDQLAVLTSRD